MNEPDRLDARMELDRQITPPYAAFADPKTRQNTFTSIGRLPPEVLSKIFKLIIGLDHTQFSIGTLQWMHLMEVCCHWRSLIIGSPLLWSWLAFHNEGLTSEMLQRSKASSLVIKVDLSDAESMLGAVALALSHISRIRILHIYVRRGRHYSAGLLAAMDQPAPLLTSLYLTNFGDTHTIPPSLFAPRLRQLVIRHLNIAWDSPLLFSLTRLEIHKSARPSSLDELRVVFSRCPALTVLVLLGNLPHAVEQQNQSQDPIPLLKLAYLHLEGPVPDCDIVIRSIFFPPATNVKLHCALDEIPAELPLLLAGLGERRGNCFSLDRLTIFKPFLSSIRVRAWASTDEDTPEDPLLQLSLRGDAASGNSCVSLICTVCKGLSPTEILSVNIDFCWHEGHVPSWMTMLDSLKNLQVLTARNPSMKWLISALTPVPITGAEKSRPWKVFLPRLQKLALDEAYFESDDTILALQNCLMLRWENHAEIQTLQLFDCSSLRNSDIDALKEIVVDVDWYGIGMEE
jgi:hypothetical protein